MKNALRTAAACALALAATGASAITFTASGPNASVSTVGNATTMTYSLTGSEVYSGQTWTLSGLADRTGTYDVDYTSNGFYAFFAVTARADQIDASGTTNLYNEFAAGCCNSPSNGFSYSGSTQLRTVAGETFRYVLFGQNFDSTSVLQGDFTINLSAVPEPDAWAMMIVGFGAVGVAMRRRPARAIA